MKNQSTEKPSKARDVMDNIFRISDGKPIIQFQGEAQGWDMCLEHMKRKGVYISKNVWQADLAQIAARLRRPKESGYLCFIKDEE
jgi:hypothetical protein